MKKNIFQYGIDLLDKHVYDSTVIVGIIGMMIFLTGFFAHTNTNFKSNIFEYNSHQENIISIDGVSYKLILEKLP